MESKESIITLLTAHFGAACVQPPDEVFRGFHMRLILEKEQSRDLAQLLHDAGFYLEYLTAVDRGLQLELIYVFNQYREPLRVQAKVRVTKGEKTSSISRIYAAADWHEREVYDFFGQIFAGHPNLKRILLPEDADYHPLLRDFRAPARLNGERGPGRP